MDAILTLLSSSSKVGWLAAHASSPRIDIEIWFAADHLARGDVDNIIKPVLDALNGVVYVDDRQVRSVRAVALPMRDIVSMTMTRNDVAARLNGEEFLINIFGGHVLPRHGP